MIGPRSDLRQSVGFGQIARWLFVLTVVLLWKCSSLRSADLEAGKDFRLALNKPIGRAWSEDPLREVLRQLSHDRNIAIVLDRRIDPSHALSLSPPDATLRELFDAIAQAIDAEAIEVGNVIYIGPRKSARVLPVLIAARGEELARLSTAKMTTPAMPANSWNGRLAALSQRKSFVWADFERPRDLLNQTATKFQIKLENPEDLAHDLWPAGALPQATAIEALSLILIQFEATFEFLPEQKSIRIVPLTQETIVEHSYSVTATNGEQILQALRQQFPKAEIVRNGFKVSVKATPEQHAAIADLLKKPTPSKNAVLKNTATQSGNPMTGTSPLLKKYSLTVKNAPLKDVLKMFEDKGVKFVYDPRKLRMADISLDDRVNLDVEDVSGGKLLRDLLEPRGLEVRIDGNSVSISPLAKPND